MEILNDEFEDFDDFEDNEEIEEESEIQEEEETEEEESEETTSEENPTDEEKPDTQVENEEKEREQKKQQNRLNAQRRKEEKAKRDEELQKQGYNKALKEAVNGINPYTNKPIEDEFDMQIYIEMRELEKQGKDPVTDYADFIANKTRQTRQAELAKQKEVDNAQKDIDSFNKEYPDVDINLLLNDEHFSTFASGKLGNIPLTQVYKDFVQFQSYYEKKAEESSNEKVVKKFARTQSNMGSMKTNSEPKKKSYREMSDEEFAVELEKVKRQAY